MDPVNYIFVGTKYVPKLEYMYYANVCIVPSREEALVVGENEQTRFRKFEILQRGPLVRSTVEDALVSLAGCLEDQIELQSKESTQAERKK
jgi:hypothetical protein